MTNIYDIMAWAYGRLCPFDYTKVQECRPEDNREVFNLFNDDGSQSSSYLISFDKQTVPISEEAIGRIMEYQTEQFKQLIRLISEDLR